MANILIIDNDVQTQENLQRFLRREGHTVVVAENGNLGLAQARTEQMDLIFCDTLMHGLTGFEVLAHLRAEPTLATIPFIFLASDTKNIAKWSEKGAVDCVTKPLDFTELGALMNKRLRGAGTRVVVVEDEASIRNNLMMILRMEGYEVIGAANGQEALPLINEHIPMLILSDIMMPEMDGHALLTALRADATTANIPFIFITAMADHNHVRDGMNLGADDYISKPFLRDELLNTVRARIARAQAQQENYRRLQQESKRLLYYDALTSLANNTLLGERLQAALIHVQRDQTRLALIMIGIDRIDRVNDTFGREVGDSTRRLISAS